MNVNFSVRCVNVNIKTIISSSKTFKVISKSKVCKSINDMNLTFMKTYFDFEKNTYNLCKGPSKNLALAKSTKLIYFDTNLVLPKVCFVHIVAK